MAGFPGVRRRTGAGESPPGTVAQHENAASLCSAAAPAGGSRLWLCLDLHRLPLEVHPGADNAPRAVLTAGGKRPLVLLCNEAAASHGVRPAMPVNAALALSPRLDIRPRTPDSELAALHRLAAWLTRFTPMVNVDGRGALLLEVAGSVGLFGGIDALRKAVVAGVRDQNHAVTTAVAPTARAASWLARCGQECLVTDMVGLPGALSRLPVSQVGWPMPVRQALHRMGVSRLGECMRLPRDGLRRRVGEPCLAQIDEAVGRRPELLEFFTPPDRFCDALDLPADTRETGLLLEALRILLGRLRHYLRARQAGAWMFWIELRHHRAPARWLRIGLLRPSTDIAHLEQLAAIHLAGSSVPEPVSTVGLIADVTEAPVAAVDLLGQVAEPGARLAQFMERLQMRLGLRAVHGIATRGDHRPEYAWQMVADLPARRPPAPGPAPAAPRPLWVLERPALLSERAGVPLFHGLLALDSGPERIETGWWDGDDIRRDYYVAHNPHGTQAWVFRDRCSGRWYLHGLFG